MFPDDHRHLLSHWHRTAPPWKGRPGHGEPGHGGGDDVLQADLCVVGGGIVGASAAYLARSQGWRVVLVDALAPALGASGRNAGMLLTGIADNYAQAVERYGRTRARKLWQLSIRNRETLLALAQELGVPHRRCGSWLLADCQEEAQALARSARLLAEDGFPHTFSESDPLGRGFLAGLFRPQDAVVHPVRLVQALVEASQAVVLAGCPATRVTSTGGRVRVQGPGFRVECDAALLATNAYSVRLDPYFRERIQPCRGQIQLTEPGPLCFPQAGYSHFGYYYFRQIPEPDDPSRGRWLIGGARHLHREAECGHLDPTTTSQVQADLRRYTQRYFPECAALPVAAAWAGTMAFTSDGLPLVGELPDRPGVYFCVGFNGHGMGLGYVAAEMVVAGIQRGRVEDRFRE